MNTEVAHSIRISDLLAEYESKKAAMADTLADWEASQKRVEAATSINGAYGGSLWSSGHRFLNVKTMQKVLLISAWRRVYQGLNIEAISTTKERDAFERSMQDPPEFTAENIKASFGEHVLNPRQVILRGLAEVFCQLDKAYRSHSNVKIGVQGLPKRVIVEGCGETYSYGFNRLRDVLNALAAYRGIQSPVYSTLNDLHRDAKRDGVAEWIVPGDEAEGIPPKPQGVKVKAFKNGNVHVMFDKVACLDINRALAEFYGDALPDAVDETPTKKHSTAVAKDLAFYRTPAAVVDQILSKVYVRKGVFKALEPSCGDGALLGPLSEFLGSEASLAGVEVDRGRVNECREAGHAVYWGNFLEMCLEPEYDLIVMNPPFYGKHWMKHVEKAWSLLKPGGQLLSILPATARYDGHLESLRLPEAAWSYFSRSWTDLPPGSFLESGTGVPTGILDICKREKKQ